jgi:hypothetical protein
MELKKAIVAALLLIAAGALGTDRPAARGRLFEGPATEGHTMSASDSGFPLRVPDRVAGWASAGEDRIYTPDNLFEYIDGGAELYLSYGLSSVFTRKYTREGEPDIMLDLFDMGSSENAFGVFSHSREKIDSTFGQGSQYTKGLLLFWKDRFYASILSSPETKASKGAVFALGRQIEKLIPREGPLPEVLGYLPQDSLVAESVRYFHHYIWLNSYYFVSDENILHINENTEAVLAKYKGGDKRWFLVVVEYPSDMEARLAREDFAVRFLPETETEPVAQLEDSTWTGCRGTGSVLAVVFNAPTREIAVGLLDEVESIVDTKETGSNDVEPK